MKPLSFAVAVAFVATTVAPAHSTGIDRDELRAKLVQILKRLGSYTPPRASTENVSCSGADGTTVSYTTSTAKDRQLTGPVRVKIGAQTTSVPALLVTTYANEDASVSMKAFKPLSSDELFAFKAELIATAAPKTDEVATYAATVSVNGGADREVTCSAFRQGAGLLKPQVPQPPTNQWQTVGDLSIACSRDAAPGAPIVSFSASGAISNRLITDVNETRSTTDTEALPSFLVSQYAFKKSATLVELDDASPAGNLIGRLKLAGVRVPTSQPAADPAIYGMWTGTYRRFDVGRELNEAVTCVAF